MLISFLGLFLGLFVPLCIRCRGIINIHGGATVEETLGFVFRHGRAPGLSLPALFFVGVDGSSRLGMMEIVGR